MASRNLYNPLFGVVLLASFACAFFFAAGSGTANVEANTISSRAEPMIYLSNANGSLFDEPSPNTISVMAPSAHFVVTRTARSSQLEEGIMLTVVRADTGVEVRGSSRDAFDTQLIEINKPLNLRREVVVMGHYRFVIVVKDNDKKVLQCHVEVPMHRLSNGMIVTCG